MANIYYANYLICIISFHYYNKPMKEILFIFHSTEKEIEGQIDK